MPPRAKEELRDFSGPQKAAMFMLAMGETNASKLFGMMDEDEIRTLSSYMANLGAVSSELIDKLFVDFSEQVSSSGSLIGTYDSTERLLSRILTEDRAKIVMEEIRGPTGRTMWDKIGNVNEGVLANYLKNEYPQTVAVVLSKIKPSHSSRVLALLPENFAMEVVMRMLRMENVQKDILSHVENTLKNEFMTNIAKTSRTDSRELIAEIFNNFDRSTETRFTTALEERNPDLAQQIKNLMFTFDDLTRLDPQGAQRLLRDVPKEQLTLALKGASETAKSLFLDNMSERAAKMLREDLEGMGPVRLKDVDEAQASIVAIAKGLAEANEIIISDDSDSSNEIIY